MKKYTFYPSVEVVAANQREAIKKLRVIKMAKNEPHDYRTCRALLEKSEKVSGK